RARRRWRRPPRARTGGRRRGRARARREHGPAWKVAAPTQFTTAPGPKFAPAPPLRYDRRMSAIVSTSRGEPARRKPCAPARRVSLFEREIRVHLGTAAIELLFSQAEVLSEGQRQGARYFGSTMITLDLGRAQTALREPCDAADARRVAQLLEKDARVQARV